MTAQAWRLPGTLLPEGEPRDLWLAGGQLTTEPLDAAELLPGRYALPGLVDAHAHVTLGETGPDPDARPAFERLLCLAREGVLVVRDIGAPRSLTLDLEADPDLPTLQVAGRWHAPEGLFFAHLHDPVAPEELLAAALAEVRRGAKWVKVIADWRDGALSYDAALLGRLVEAVHAAGARVAAHTQWPLARDVVSAGVDSIEHGFLLDRDAVEAMASQGTAWTPTLTAFRKPPPPDETPGQQARRQAYLDNLRELLPAAADRGVTILAGTDHAGSVVDEVRQLIAFGLSPVQALRAASTEARRYLGIPSLDASAPADVVTYDEDPREDPSVLERPAAIVMRGRRIA